MKALVFATVVTVALVISASGASAGEPGGKSTENGNLSAGQLAAMGLSGMIAISDRQAEQIRGNGFALTFGRSFAFGGTPDGYFRPQSNVSSGVNFSSGHGTWAGGGSFAFGF